MATGVIKFYKPGPPIAFGFIRRADGTDIYFARHNLSEDTDEAALVEDCAVSYDEVTTPKVTYATNVKVC
ncbi:MAG TPA: hypothetical protein VGM90_08940 [Kofleriaceae bacterium]|jgi:cold shock CspA family protein